MPKRLEMGSRPGLAPGNGYSNDDRADDTNPADEREINVPLLRKMLEHVTSHPDEWNQDTWAVESEESSCGTAYCLAGHTAESLGHTLVWQPGTNMASFCLAGGELRTIESVATHALGLKYTEAAGLFSACNELHTLWEIANKLTNGEIEIPDDLEARSGS